MDACMHGIAIIYIGKTWCMVVRPSPLFAICPLVRLIEVGNSSGATPVLLCASKSLYSQLRKEGESIAQPVA